MLKEGFFVVSASEADQMLDECGRCGWKVFRLPPGISSKDEFFEGVRGTLPLDPPLQSNRSWDALADSLWSGLDSLSETKIVVVWSDASRMETLGPEDLAIASSILAELPASLADTGTGATRQLLVLRVV